MCECVVCGKGYKWALVIQFLWFVDVKKGQEQGAERGTKVRVVSCRVRQRERKRQCTTCSGTKTYQSSCFSRQPTKLWSKEEGKEQKKKARLGLAEDEY